MKTDNNKDLATAIVRSCISGAEVSFRFLGADMGIGVVVSDVADDGKLVNSQVVVAPRHAMAGPHLLQAIKAATALLADELKTINKAIVAQK